MSTIDMVIASVNGNATMPRNPVADDIDATLNTGPAHTFQTTATLADDVIANLLSDNPTAGVVTLPYSSTRKNGAGITVRASVANGDDWRPVAFLTAHGVTNGKATEYDAIMTDGAAIRGGTILAIEVGYKVDTMGFRQHNAAPIVAGLRKAFFRQDAANRNRIDTDFRLMANDQQAKDYATVAGFILVRIKGYRFK